MPCECSIKRSASSSSSLDRSLDKRGPATGDGASVVDAGLDMMRNGLDGQTCPGQNAQHVLRASEVRTKESRQAEVLRECATWCSLSGLSSSDNLGEDGCSFLAT